MFKIKLKNILAIVSILFLNISASWNFTDKEESDIRNILKVREEDYDRVEEMLAGISEKAKKFLMIDAIKHNDAQLLKSILSFNIDPNFYSPVGNTPLVLAVSEKLPLMVDILVKLKNIDVDKANRSEVTPLGLAIDWKKFNSKNADDPKLKNAMERIIKSLIDHKANVNKPSYNTKLPPIFLAALWGSPSIVKLLIDAQADVNQRGIIFTAKDKYIADDFPLNEAVNSGCLKCVELLIRAGADINSREAELFKETPLFQAIRMNNLEMVRLITSFPNVDYGFRNKAGMTALEYAQFHEKPEIAKIIEQAQERKQ